LLRLEALYLFVQNPILGVGSRNYVDRSLLAGDNAGTYPHNFLAEQAAESGIVGTATLLVLLAVTLYRDLRNVPKMEDGLRSLRYALFCGALAIIIEALAENSLYVWQIWCVMWLLRGISAKVAFRPSQFLAADTP
jgi:O-antigen ligase